MTAAEYIEAVQNKELRDPVLGFQICNGFEPLGVLEKYLPADKDQPVLLPI